jgi:hypothetical protein
MGVNVGLLVMHGNTSSLLSVTLGLLLDLHYTNLLLVLLLMGSVHQCTQMVCW